MEMMLDGGSEIDFLGNQDDEKNNKTINSHNINTNDEAESSTQENNATSVDTSAVKNETELDTPEVTDNNKEGDEEKASDLPERKNGSRRRDLRTSTRLRDKRPRLPEIVVSSDEERHESDDDIIEIHEVRKAGRRRIPLRDPTLPPRPRGRPRKHPIIVKKVKEYATPKKEGDGGKVPKEFSSGAYVVMKSDYHASMTPPLWRIDGKALLQKYTPVEENGETLYKNTSTYSGWTASNRGQYYPAPVEIKQQNRKETFVRLLREKIRTDQDVSDS